MPNPDSVLLPRGAPAWDTGRADAAPIEAFATSRTRVARGVALVHADDPFQYIYLIRFGFMKSTCMLTDGRAQVTGFHQAGDLVGIDGMASNRHVSETVALEDSEVAVIPFPSAPGPGSAAFTLAFHGALSRELVRTHGMLMMLGAMDAEQRIATFLLSLSQRLKGRGYSPSEFVLRMTRAEIGSFLGLSLETVSRQVSQLARAGILEVDQRYVRIVNRAALHGVMVGDGQGEGARDVDDRRLAAQPREAPFHGLI